MEWICVFDLLTGGGVRFEIDNDRYSIKWTAQWPLWPAATMPTSKTSLMPLLHPNDWILWRLVGTKKGWMTLWTNEGLLITWTNEHTKFYCQYISKNFLPVNTDHRLWTWKEGSKSMRNFASLGTSLSCKKRRWAREKASTVVAFLLRYKVWFQILKLYKNNYPIPQIL